MPPIKQTLPGARQTGPSYRGYLTLLYVLEYCTTYFTGQAYHNQLVIFLESCASHLPSTIYHLPSTTSSSPANSATWASWPSLYVPKSSALPSRSPAGTSNHPPPRAPAQFEGIVHLILTLKQIHRSATCGNGSLWACLVSWILFYLSPYISNGWSHIAPQRINLPVRLSLSKRL